MESGKIYERHTRFQEALTKLATFPLSENPTLAELRLSKAIIQASYRDMKNEDFKGSLVDFWAYVSMLYLLEMFNKFKTLSPEVSFKEFCKVEPINTKNMMRLVFSNPEYLIESESYRQIGIASYRNF